VLVGHDGRVRVVDFGVARSVDAAFEPHPCADASRIASLTSLTKTGALVGTPAYMAPEQLLGDEVDARSDQFGFAVALWEALHGARPFAGKTPAALARAIELSDPSLGPTSDRAPLAITRVLRKALSARASERYPSMDALVLALDDAPVSERRLRLAGAPPVEIGDVVGWR
jgi:serine/threonine protein kinase